MTANCTCKDMKSMRHSRFRISSSFAEIPLTDVDPVIYVRARDSEQNSVGTVLRTCWACDGSWENKQWKLKSGGAMAPSIILAKDTCQKSEVLT